MYRNSIRCWKRFMLPLAYAANVYQCGFIVSLVRRCPVAVLKMLIHRSPRRPNIKSIGIGLNDVHMMTFHLFYAFCSCSLCIRFLMMTFFSFRVIFFLCFFWFCRDYAKIQNKTVLCPIFGYPKTRTIIKWTPTTNNQQSTKKSKKRKLNTTKVHLKNRARKTHTNRISYWPSVHTQKHTHTSCT